ncbi:hypothetical protein HRE53_29605 (plasmid) [Acaryochloris sp. 'Moss Beach']|uniref:hypothetical protein n=1 Tax=Acaryochloris sp. 'Moss Beach' TaxID=2740837 RepID=UPI001F192B76|nr:hypothetical protein [Acaryochloris sp. 'Moss Beach']UJB72769.1 hypothetical protein HRE53_29605 [Acaryochloris sp. 'Moss Beach']
MSLGYFFFGKRDNSNIFRFKLVEDNYRMLCCITTNLLAEEALSNVSTPMALDVIAQVGAIQTIPGESEFDQLQLDTVLENSPTEESESFSEVIHDNEPIDDLDKRLKEHRRSRAKTFRKVSSLFNRIFGE